jgi:hypothetical protein
VKPNLTCEEYLRVNKACVHNGGTLGVCLCDKHYNHRDEEWTAEEKEVYARKFREFLGEPFHG